MKVALIAALIGAGGAIAAPLVSNLIFGDGPPPPLGEAIVVISEFALPSVAPDTAIPLVAFTVSNEGTAPAQGCRIEGAHVSDGDEFDVPAHGSRIVQWGVETSGLEGPITTTATVNCENAGSEPVTREWTINAVKIQKIVFDPAGSDTRSNSHLNQEIIVITNTRGSRVSLRDWTISDRSGHVYRFTSVGIDPHEEITVHTGKGPDTSTDKYWRESNYVWDNDGDEATLTRANGSLADTCNYSGGGSSMTC